MATSLPPLQEVERLSPLVLRILGGNPGKFTLQGTNTYLLGMGRNRLLIDTAEGLPSWSSALSSVLARENATISTVLLTHYHHDHVLGVPDVLSLCPDAEIYKFPAEVPYPSRRETHGKEEEAHALPADTMDGTQRLPEQVRKSISQIQDQQSSKAEGVTLRAHHTPGHTPDHLAFYLEEEDALFTGDAVLGHGTAVFENLAAYMACLEKMENLFQQKDDLRSTSSASTGGGPKKGRAYPGHGAVIEDGLGKLREYIAHRKQREMEVWDVLKGEPEGRTPMEVVKVVYQDVREDLHQAAAGGVVLVLGKMEGEGRVKKVGERWVVVDENGKESL